MEELGWCPAVVSQGQWSLLCHTLVIVPLL
jgi:hypothetical protein